MNKKGDRHRSEAEPAPVPLRAEADAAGRRRSDAASRRSSERCGYAKLCLDCPNGKRLGFDK
jgi:hypothetical protein